MDEHPREWNSVKRKTCNTGGLELSGSSLKRAPKGFDPEHKLIEDLKRKDFIATCNLPKSAIYDKDFPKQTTKLLKAGAPLMEFICSANDLMF